MPLTINPANPPRGAHFLGVLARRKPGISTDQAQAEMKTIAERLAVQYPASNANESAEVVLLHEQIVGAIRPALMTLFAAVVVVVLIACANVANLLLVRASVREKEIAIRAAIRARRDDSCCRCWPKASCCRSPPAASACCSPIWRFRRSRHSAPQHSARSRCRDRPARPGLRVHHLARGWHRVRPGTSLAGDADDARRRTEEGRTRLVVIRRPLVAQRAPHPRGGAGSSCSSAPRCCCEALRG